MKQSLSLFIVIVITLGLSACSSTTENAAKAVAPNPSPSPTENLEQAIVANSKATWEAYKNRDVAGIKSYTAEDYESYQQTGPSNLQQDIANIDQLNIASYKMIDPKVKVVTKDVALLRYKWEPQATYDKKPLKPVYITEVWASRNGKWQVVSYQESIITQ